MYIKSHHRAVPYFVGMAGAYLFVYLQKIDYKFPKVRILLLLKIIILIITSPVSARVL